MVLRHFGGSRGGSTRSFVSLASLMGIALARCSSPTDPNPVNADNGLAPPAAGQGIQYKMVTTLEPGQEIERCQMFKIGADGMAFNHTDIRYSPGSHHVLLFETSYGGDFPTKDKNGVALDPSQPHDCSDGAAARWDVVRVVGGSQNATGDNLLSTLPDGVAIKLKPNTIVVMNTHYLNASSQKLTADARINLYTVPVASVKTEAGVLFYYNPFIDVAAQSQNSAHMRCALSHDITLLNVQSHMHKRGVGYSASVIDVDGKASEIYTNTHWENVPIKAFDGGLKLKAGQALDYRCDYKNNETREIYQGLTTKDEMCMLVGSYYPRNDNLEVCQTAEGDLDGAATWYGTGTADCGESYKCMADAQKAPKADQARMFYGCVVRSCDTVAAPLSAVLHCQISNGHGACNNCTGADCQTCVLDKCAKEINACGAAACK